MPENCYPFELQPLPYDYNALEPYINTQTMQIHHDRLLKAYVDKLNATLVSCPRLQKMSLEEMLRNKRNIPMTVKTQIVNFGGGVYNHNFFFYSLRSGDSRNMPMGNISGAINRTFGSFEKFKEIFTEKALSVFGSGWLWLVKNCRGGLSIVQTANQDCPISLGYEPIVVIDVWEHAYFLQYLNLRNEYINNWFCVIDWEKANAAYTNRSFY